MSRQDPLYSWTKELTKTFPDLSKPQLKGLAEWSFGMILARCCSLDSVASYMADWLEQPELSVRSRLREWYLPADRKSVSSYGDKRKDLPVRSCFAPLLNWLRRDWPQPRLALALDASTLGERFVLLAVSVLYRRSAFPVAWKVLPATAKGTWRPHWLELLQALRGVIPANWLVVALADRGLWAKWLFQEIQLLGWHPLMRVNGGGYFRPDGARRFIPVKQMVPKVGMSWRGQGTAFATPGRQMAGTLLGWWGSGYKEPWLLLSDLAPQQGDASWYGLRSWIEQGFKDSKRGGWQWQHTGMEDPERAERLWLAIAVATLWLLRVGGSAEAAAEARHAIVNIWQYEQMCRKCWGKSSVFARGHREILMALLKHGRLPLGQWVPEPWPELPLR
jgi:Transposase DDE domain